MVWLWALIGIIVVYLGHLIKELIEKYQTIRPEQKLSQQQPQVFKKPEFFQKSVSSSTSQIYKQSNGTNSNQLILNKQSPPREAKVSPEKNQAIPQQFRKITPLKPFIEDPQITNRASPQKKLVQFNSNPIIQNFDELVKKKIITLYNKSCRSRGPNDQWAKFIGPIERGADFIDWYGDSNAKLKKQLSQVLQGYRRVRGDGNCYYTSVAFQYFQIILTKYSDQQFKQIIDEMQQMQFQIYYHNFYIEEALQNPCARILAEILQCLRFQPEGLYTMMSDPEQEMYALSVIYIRNLANATYRKDSLIKTIIQPDLADEVLTWECQCNNTEMLHSSLAKFLDMYVYYLLQGERRVNEICLWLVRETLNSLAISTWPLRDRDQLLTYKFKQKCHNQACRSFKHDRGPFIQRSSILRTPCSIRTCPICQTSLLV